MFGIYFTAAARRRAERKARRRAFREAENAIDTVKARQKDLEKESKKQWVAAHEALKSGQKAAANRSLVAYRASQVLAMKLEQKCWAFQQYVVKLEMAQSDSEFSSALNSINKIIQIDPDKVADVFEDAEDKLGEQLAVDKFWEKVYGKEMEGASGSLEDYIPSVEEMTMELEHGVAAELGSAAPAAADATINDKILSGQQKVKDLLDGK